MTTEEDGAAETNDEPRVRVPFIGIGLLLTSIAGGVAAYVLIWTPWLGCALAYGALLLALVELVAGLRAWRRGAPGGRSLAGAGLLVVPVVGLFALSCGSVNAIGSATLTAVTAAPGMTMTAAEAAIDVTYPPHEFWGGERTSGGYLGSWPNPVGLGPRSGGRRVTPSSAWVFCYESTSRSPPMSPRHRREEREVDERGVRSLGRLRPDAPPGSGPELAEDPSCQPSISATSWWMAGIGGHAGFLPSARSTATFLVERTYFPTRAEVHLAEMYMSNPRSTSHVNLAENVLLLGRLDDAVRHYRQGMELSRGPFGRTLMSWGLALALHSCGISSVGGGFLTT
ncbi:MAG TPA: hypothetical protein RMH99_00475 [Sandaracinaceae bacterium LLY-WYZ-13_1]|nr:hypothetical protein [Sandaracinaceae bacterium LLY-WYZ-13_1]